LTTFIRVTMASADDKAAKLLCAIKDLRVPSRHEDSVASAAWDVQPSLFSKVPGSPFAYWVSDSIRRTFSRLASFASGDRTALVGLQTSDDYRFIRAWWEVDPSQIGKRWFGFAKGGSFSPFYADIPLVVGYSRGDQVGLQAIGRYGRGATHYFRPGLTWPSRTDGLSFRVIPRQCIFSHKGPTAFVEPDDPSNLFSLAALLNSRPFRYLVAVQLARMELAQSYEVGLIQQTPMPNLSRQAVVDLSQLARQAWSIRWWMDSSHETSHAFLVPQAINDHVTRMNQATPNERLDEIQSRIDELAFDLYEIEGQDRDEIESSTGRAAPRSGTEAGSCEEEDEESDIDDSQTSPADSIFPIMSWLLGAVFGRFDVRLVTGERAVPPEPDPFDPLAARSPGMWPADEERPVPPPDLLVDDLGHARDIGSQVSVEAELVGVSMPEDPRRWLAREFFPLHIKMYSKSRRKAPIYWQLATPSASYSVWLYVHAFSGDTMFRVQNDYVVPKLRHEESRLETLEREAGEKATAAQRKAIAEQEAFVEELRGFLDEVKRVAPLWNPDLDDGVIINFALLWRLVPHHRPWQKELNATWDALCEGKYDWARLAMRLWPERVVPKCAADRSLAIAHGLEDVFWAQGSDGRWAARTTPARPLDDVIAERASDAVKAALRNLLDAPAIVGARAGRRRAAAGGSNRGGR
jgi:hypothetical protein